MRSFFNRGLWAVSRLVAVVPPILFLILCFVIARREFHHSREELWQAVATEVSSALNAEVSVTSVTVATPTRLEVTGLRLSKKGFGTLLTARTASAHYNLLKMLKNLDAPASAVTSISADGPVVYLERDERGRLNYHQAFASKKPAKKRFQGFITVTDGAVRYIDHAVRSRAGQPLRMSGTGVNARADLRSINGGSFSGTMAATNASGRTAVAGEFSYTGRLALNVQSKAMSLPFVDAFLTPSSDMRLYAGTAEGRLVLTRQAGHKAAVHLWWQGRMADARLKVPGHLPELASVNAEVAVAGADYLSVNGTTRAAGALWRVNGAVLTLRKPVLWLDVSSERANYSRLEAFVPGDVKAQGISAAGNGPLVVHLRGAMPDVTITGRAAAPLVSWAGHTVKDARASFSFSDGRISLPAFSARLGGGMASGFGTVDISGKQPKAEGRVRFTGVALAQVSPRLNGQAWGNAIFSLADGRQAGSVDFQVRNPEAFGRRASSALGRLRFSGQQVTVDSLLVSTPRGFATASGSVSLKGALNLNLTAAGLSDGDILGPGQSDGASGWLSADGRVTGTVSDPVFSGQLQILDAVYQGHAVDSITGALTASRSRLTTSGLTVIQGGSEIVVTGDVLRPLSPDRRLELAASIKSFNTEDFASIIPALADVQGQVSGEISNVSGPPRALHADFNLTIEGARYKAYSAPYMTARGSFDRGELILQSLKATRGEAVLMASGTAGRDGALDFDFNLQTMPLGDAVLLVMNRQMPVSGSVDIFGHVGGTRADPVVSASLTGRDLMAGSEPLSVSRSEMVWRSNLLDVSGAALSAAGGRVAVENLRISTDPDTAGVLSARLAIGNTPGAVDRVDLGRLLAMVRGIGILADLKDPRARGLAFQAPEHVQGSLGGTVTITRAPGGLLASGDLNISSLQAWGTPVGQVNLTASTGPEGAKVQSLHIEDKEMLITASGSLDKSGALSADVEGNNVELNRIPVIKAFAEAAGTSDFSFEASGTLSNPKVIGSVTVSDANISGFPVERFATGQITAEGDAVNIAESTLVSGDQRVRVEGTLPFSLAKMAFVDGGKIDMHAQAVNPTLDALALMTSLVDTERTSGDMVARVDMTGSWPSPQLNGLVSVDNGSLAIRNMTTAFRDVNVNIVLEGDRVDIKTFTMRSTDGGELTVTGGAHASANGWVTNATARADNLGLKFRNISGSYNESYNGKLDINLGASGDLLRPLIAGRITPHNGVIGLPVFPDTGAQPVQTAFNPSFDVALVAGNDVKVKGPRMNVDVRGQIQIAQTLQDPLVTGNLDVLAGYLLFPGTRFRVVPVGTLAFRYESPGGSRVSMDVRAETQISASPASAAFSASTYRVEMHASGSLDDPKVTFQSYPPGLETNRIFALLGQRAGVGPGGFDTQGGFEKEVARLFTANIAPGVLEPIESALAEALGFQEVTFGFGQYEPMNVMLRRRLFDGVSMQYWRSLEAGQELEEWKFLYDVTDRLRLTYGRNRFDVTSVGIEGSLSF